MFALIIDSGADESPAAPTAIEQKKQAARFESFQQGVCGQVITGSVTLTQDISNCEGNGIIIGADYVVLDGDGHTIAGVGQGSGVTSNDRHHVIIRNCLISGFQHGVHLASKDGPPPPNNAMDGYRSQQNVIEKSTFAGNQHGITLNRSHHTRITGNSILDNTDTGITLQGSETYSDISSSHTTIRKNLIAGNRRGISFRNPYFLPQGQLVEENTFRQNAVAVTDRFLKETNIRYRGNTFTENMNTIFLRFHGDHDLSVGKLKRFEITVHNSDGTPASDIEVASVTTSPEEAITHTTTLNRITCEFTPDRRGLYSVAVGLKTGGGQERIIQRYWFGTERTKKVYLGPGYRRDVGDLMEKPPSSPVRVWCTMWIEAHLKATPPEPGIAKLTGVHTAFWMHHTSKYKYASRSGTDLFLEFDNTFSRRGDHFLSIAGGADRDRFKSDVSFGKGVFLYTAADWMGLTVKWQAIDPVWTSDPENPSVVTLSYLITDAPVIETVSNRNVQILSATTAKGKGAEVEIVLEGQGKTMIEVRRPDPSRSYSVSFDGVPSSDTKDCAVEQTGKMIRTTVNLSAIHKIRISQAQVHFAAGGGRRGAIRRP